MQTVQYSTTIQLGENQLDLDTHGLSDEQVLSLLAEYEPKGVNVWTANAGPVWVNPNELLGLAHADGFGLELTGIGHTAAEIVRLACDAQKAAALGETICSRFINTFEIQAQDRAVSKRVNQLHGVRWGSGFKVVCAERVHPGTFEYNPYGKWARKCSQMTGLFVGHKTATDTDGNEVEVFVDDIAHEWFLVERHPFLGPIMVQAIPNPKVSRATVLFNRADWRCANLGDEDGDTGNAFHAQTEYVNGLRAEIEARLPGNDPHLLVRGIEAHHTDAEMWGENIFESGKTTQSRLDLSFTKTIDAWIHSHKKMAACANEFTPYSYRISDICGQASSLGVPGAAEAAMLGAVIEEVFYLGLSGGPESLDDALETWFKKRMNRTAIATMFAGFRTVVDPHLLTTDVKAALITCAKYNQERFEEYDPIGAVTRFNWLVGKGLTTVQHRQNADPIGRLERLAFISGEIEVPDAVRDSLCGRMAFYAARHLAQFVRPLKDRAPDDGGDWWGEQDDDIANLAEE